MSAKKLKFSTFVSIAFIKLGLLIVQLDYWMGQLVQKLELKKQGVVKSFYPKNMKTLFT